MPEAAAGGGGADYVKTVNRGWISFVDDKLTWWWQALEAESGQDYRPHDQQGAGAAQSFNSMCQGTIACARVLMPGYYRAQQSTACSISDTWEMNSEPPEFTQ